MSEGDESSEETILLPYRSVKGRLIAGSSLLMPIGIVMFFVVFCLVGEDDGYKLESMVKVSVLYRVGLLLHGVYFAIHPFALEFLMDYGEKMLPEKLQIGAIPERVDNLYWMMTSLSAELFFVTAVFLFLIASQSYVPRWALILPIAQCGYNLKNNLIWTVFGSNLSPINKRIDYAWIDFAYIAICFIIYVIHFFTE